MTYRDRLLTCAHCGAPLSPPRLGSRRAETYPCPSCGGVAIHEEELGRLLARFAPELGTPVPLAPRIAPRARPCPLCLSPMTAISLVDVPLDQCAKDQLVWFDPDDLEQTIQSAIADQAARRGWAQRLRDLLFAN